MVAKKKGDKPYKHPKSRTLTLTRAKKLSGYDILHHNTHRNADGSCERWRLNGQVQLWKTDPGRIRIPVKRGMYEYDQLTASDLQHYHLESQCRNPKG